MNGDYLLRRMSMTREPGEGCGGCKTAGRTRRLQTRPWNQVRDVNVEPEPRRAGAKAKTTTTHVSPVPMQA